MWKYGRHPICDCKEQAINKKKKKEEENTGVKHNSLLMVLRKGGHNK